MTTWKVKGCPRCRGDVFIDKDMDGWYEQCLQCSYRHELKELAEFKEEQALAKGKGKRPRFRHAS
ncbi:hypothetical protein ACFL4C_01345 [Candidatus Omnitrophota bacterium]